MKPSSSTRFSVVACAALGALTALLLPRDARAFCLQTTCASEDCPEDSSGCVSEGEPLFYDVPCHTFGVDMGSAESLGLDDQEMIDIVAEAFARWRAADCPGGGNPNFEVSSVGVVDANGIFFCKAEELNLGVWRVNEQWKHVGTALGYTTSNFVVDSGEIYDADVEINGPRMASVVGEADMHDAVLSVALHEAGHVLGLAHANVRSSVMAESYSDLRPRELTEDDIAGICDLYPPSDEPLRCSEPGVSEAAYEKQACEEALADAPNEDGGCSVAPRASALPGQGARATSWAALGLVLGFAARRRARRP